MGIWNYEIHTICWTVCLYPFKDAHKIGLSGQSQFSSIIYVSYQENPTRLLLQSMVMDLLRLKGNLICEWVLLSQEEVEEEEAVSPNYFGLAM